MVALLFPRFDHPAIEERYASWQAEMRLRSQASEVHYYETGERAAHAVRDVEDEQVVVVTDPLLLSPSGLVSRLAKALGDAEAIVPVSNESGQPLQRRSPEPYMTLRELDVRAAQLEEEPLRLQRVVWDKTDPGMYLCRTDLLDAVQAPPHEALEGRNVDIAGNVYVHRWASMRGQTREDLLGLIDNEARSILEFGCGEAPLGAALKARQRCRVVGVELDKHAAAVARRRIDDVYQGDIREIVSILHERFDWIIGGDIVEHLDDPWSFLADLRRLSAPGGHLLMSLPNIANASVIGDLLHGRFDYVYMGLTCVGHLRFFTRNTIEELLRISGWQPVSITAQQLAVTNEATTLMNRLADAKIGFSREDLTVSGYYVVAQNR